LSRPTRFSWSCAPLAPQPFRHCSSCFTTWLRLSIPFSKRESFSVLEFCRALLACGRVKVLVSVSTKFVIHKGARIHLEDTISHHTHHTEHRNVDRIDKAASLAISWLQKCFFGELFCFLQKCVNIHNSSTCHHHRLMSRLVLAAKGLTEFGSVRPRQAPAVHSIRKRACCLSNDSTPTSWNQSVRTFCLQLYGPVGSQSKSTERCGIRRRPGTARLGAACSGTRNFVPVSTKDQH